MRLLESTGIPIPGANAVVLGRSDIVGSPVSVMLRSKDATVTQCHSKSRNLPEIVCSHTPELLIDLDILRSKMQTSLSPPSENPNLCKAHGSSLVQW